MKTNLLSFVMIAFSSPVLLLGMDGPYYAQKLAGFIIKSPEVGTSSDNLLQIDDFLKRLYEYDCKTEKTVPLKSEDSEGYSERPKEQMNIDDFLKRLYEHDYKTEKTVPLKSEDSGSFSKRPKEQKYTYKDYKKIIENSKIEKIDYPERMAIQKEVPALITDILRGTNLQSKARQNFIRCIWSKIEESKEAQEEGILPKIIDFERCRIDPVINWFKLLNLEKSLQKMEPLFIEVDNVKGNFKTSMMTKK